MSSAVQTREVGTQYDVRDVINTPEKLFASEFAITSSSFAISSPVCSKPQTTLGSADASTDFE